MFSSILSLGLESLNLSPNFWEELGLYAKNIRRLTSLEEVDDTASEETEVILISPFMVLPEFWFSKFPNLGNVIVLGTDTGRVSPALADNKVQIHNLPSYCTRSVAEFALASLLKKTRGLEEKNTPNIISEKHTSQISDLTELSIGILGCGNIGSLLAMMLLGLGSRVSSYDIIREKEISLPQHQTDSIESLFSKNDFVFVLIPLNSQNEKFISSELLNKMKKDSTIINISPLDVYNFDELKDVLSDGKINFISHQSHGKQGSFEKFCDLPNVTIYPPVAHASQAACKKREQDCLDIVMKLRQAIHYASDSEFEQVYH